LTPGRYTLERTVRKELERSWRVFTRDPAAAFTIVADNSLALAMLSTMEIQQGARIQHLGLNFILNDETSAAFYRNLVGDGVDGGYAVMSALTVGEEVVATLLGIRDGARYVMVRISNAGERWSNCSPGRLIIERTMAALHKDGVREFDFSIGNYAYKPPVRRCAAGAGRSRGRPELARNSLCAARSRSTPIAPLSAARNIRQTRARQAAHARRELSHQAKSYSRIEECPMNPSHVYAVKRAISAYAPALFSAIRRSRLALHQRRNVRLQSALTPWKESFIRKFNFVVQSGPFAGMKFHRSDAASAYLPLLIGSYEAETHAFIETALARAPKTILDVGCDAGYVAVGLALRAPAAIVFAFDIRAEARSECRALASLNEVEKRVVVGEECTPERLAICGERSLVFCDCEGYELDLLDPKKAPQLKNADIIVELHDFMRVDIAMTPEILSRFADTHEIAVTGVQRRSAEDFPCLSILPREVRNQALHEDRVQYQHGLI